MTTDRPPSNLPDEAQAWRRSLEEDVDNLKREAGITRTNNAAIQQAQGSIAGAIARAGLDIADQAEAIQDARRVPAAPANPSVASDAYFDEYGVPRAKVFASSDMVILDTRGEPISVAYHELFGRPAGNSGTAWQKLAETYTLPPSFEFAPLPAGDSWEFSTGAVSIVGVAGERSATVTMTLAKDNTPPPKPSKPITSSRLGQVMINWDGKTDEGGSQPADFSHAEVLMATSLSGAGLKVGTIDKDGDTFYAPEQDYNVVRWFFLVSVDHAGNRSVPSERADVATKPLVDTDVSDEILDSITETVMENVGTNIGGTVTWALTAPVVADGAGKAAGALWYRRDGNNNIIGMWEWTGSAWSKRQFDNETLATLDAGKINAGYLDAARIDASTITTDKLLVGNFTNLVDDPGLSKPIGKAWWNSGTTSGWGVVDTSGGPGKAIIVPSGDSDSLILYNTNRFVAREGDQFTIQARMQNAFNSGGLAFEIAWRDNAGNAVAGSGVVALPGSGWTNYAGTVTAPAGVAYGLIVIRRGAGSTSGNAWITKFFVAQRSTSEMIVDGSITALKIATNAIEADKISSNAITADKIAAGAITTVKLGAGSITADKIAVGSITADRLTLGDTTNQVENAGFETGNFMQWTAPGGWTIQNSAAHSGSYRAVCSAANAATLISNTIVEVQAGEIWVVSGWFANDLATGSNVSLGVQTDQGTVIATAVPINNGSSSYQQISYQFTIPGNVSKIRFRVGFNSTGSSGFIRFDDAYLRRAVSGELIVNGAVTADKISAGAIEADKIAAGAVTAGKIAADAVTAAKIAATAIDGMTITGALIRSSASGARTELNSSGVRVINSANQELVRLGYGIPTGMSVRDPATGSLVALAAHVFGTTGSTASNSLSVPKPGSTSTMSAPIYGAFVDTWHQGSTPVSSPTGRLLVLCSTDMNDITTRQNYDVTATYDLMHAYSGAASYTRIAADTAINWGANTLFRIMDVTPGASYYLRTSYRCMMYNNSGTPRVDARTIVAMPI